MSENSLFMLDLHCRRQYSKENIKYSDHITKEIAHFSKSENQIFNGVLNPRKSKSYSMDFDNSKIQIDDSHYFGLLKIRRKNSSQLIQDFLDFLIESSNEKSSKKFPKQSNFVSKKLNYTVRNFLLNILKNHFLFSSLEYDLLDAIIMNMVCFIINPNEIIFEKGDNSDFFFIIEEGQVERKIKENETIFLQKGDYFGDYTILYEMCKQDSMRALQKTTLWGLSNHLIHRVIKKITMNKFQENFEFIKNLPYFNDLTIDQKENLAYKLVIKKFQKSSEFVLNYLKYNSLFVIQEGEVYLCHDEKIIKCLKKGDYFGNFFLQETNYNIKVISEHVICLEICNETFNEVFGKNFLNLIHYNIRKEAFKSSQILKSLTFLQINKLIEKMTNISFSKGSQILIEKYFKSKIIICLEGQLISNNGKIKIKKGDTIGEEILMNENFKIDSDYFVVKIDTIISYITKEEFENILKKNFIEILQINKNSHEILFSPEKIHASIQKENIDLKSLLIIKQIGNGHSGIVLLVKDVHKLYALKIISKEYVINNKLENYIRNEKKILWQLDFPFIIHLYRSFVDESNIFFLFQFINGDSLYEVWMQNDKKFSLFQLKFYSALLILCLQYLHLKGIIHRDIKPENIMVDIDGYIKLIDFGMSKSTFEIETSTLKERNKTNIDIFYDEEEKEKEQFIPKTFRTFTICGTPHYTAPEVINSKGYSYFIDYWSLGICMYQFITGRLPFGDQEDDPIVIFKDILTKKTFDTSLIEDDCVKSIIIQLLDKRPFARLGGSEESLKNHKFFDDFSWDNLMKKEIIPIYIPNKNKEKLEIDIEEAKTANITFEKLLQTQQMKEYYERSKNIKVRINGWDQIFF